MNFNSKIKSLVKGPKNKKRPFPLAGEKEINIDSLISSVLKNDSQRKIPAYFNNNTNRSKENNFKFPENSFFDGVNNKESKFDNKQDKKYADTIPANPHKFFADSTVLNNQDIYSNKL
jgi:hypothetical protein